MEATIILDGSNWFVGEYIIVGNYDDGYAVRYAEDGEDGDILYENISFESCVVWCLNS